jgi:hypothetical protein
VPYFGLNPRVRQSGNQPAAHGRITKAGPGYARGMFVEAAFSTSKAPGPLRGFYQRVRARRGIHLAVVATARKLTVLCRQLMINGEDYAFAMPSWSATSSASSSCAPGRRPRTQRGHRGALLPQAGARRRTRPGSPKRTGLPNHGRQLASHSPDEQDTNPRGRTDRQWTRPPAPGHDCFVARVPVTTAARIAHRRSADNCRATAAAIRPAVATSGGHDRNSSTSITASTNGSGASWGRLCPTPPGMVRCVYWPENFVA